MPRHIAFLRAINVSGHNVKMDHLRQLFESLGFSNVETFIASGNVIFETKTVNTKLLENQKVIVQLEHKLNILRRADTKAIDMKGLGIAPDAKVLVYWNPIEKSTLLSIQNLPVPPKGKQYQLWAIVDKKPVDAGVFMYDATAVQEMKAFDHAEAFAVTLEPEGGSTAPTVDKMYVLGTVL